MRDHGPFSERESRAARLLARQPHAAEILGLYRQVLARQEPLYRQTLTSGWPGSAEPENLDPPALGLEQLPFSELVRTFRPFIDEVAAFATQALASAGAALATAPGELLEALLRQTVRQQDLEALADSLGCQVPHLVFYSRAYLQPIAEALAARHPSELGNGVRRSCPRCAWPPQVAAVRDEPEIKGRRILVCGLCATAWPYPRGTCPSCREDDTAKLILHESDSLPHIRVEECSLCKAYIKSVDLRRDGAAVPLVDDIASVELDLWSEERGLWKIARNLMGL